MVADKIHARARGQVQMLTDSQLKVELEVVVFDSEKWSETALSVTAQQCCYRDRLLEESDKYTLYICENCGQIAYFDMKQRRYVCRICDEKAKISPVIVSYAFKLLLQELQSLCITPKLRLKEKA